MKIGFVTCDPEKLKHYFPTLAEPDFVPTEPGITPDDQLAVNALRHEGHEVEAIIWGCPIESLKKFDLVIVRSPWDYMDNAVKTAAFMRWVNMLERSGVPVSNPLPFMQWSLDKHYLRDLQKNHVAVIPTEYYEVGSHLDLTTLFKQKGAFIIKPCLSAGGVGLFYIKTEEEAALYQAEVNKKLVQCAHMVQEFIPEICTQGEWSLIFLGGHYSHAVHKKPAAGSIFVHAERGGSLSLATQPSPEVIDFAKSVYAAILPAFKQATGLSCDPVQILYLRIDIIETARGPLLIECEGVEPELFFRASPRSEFKFSEAIASLCVT